MVLGGSDSCPAYPASLAAPNFVDTATHYLVNVCVRMLGFLGRIDLANHMWCALSRESTTEAQHSTQQFDKQSANMGSCPPHPRRSELVALAVHGVATDDDAASTATVTRRRYCRPFECALSATRPYRRISMENTSTVSLSSSQRPAARWSLFSGGSNTSVFSLELPELHMTEKLSILSKLSIRMDNYDSLLRYDTNIARRQTHPAPVNKIRSSILPHSRYLDKSQLPDAVKIGDTRAVLRILGQGVDIEANNPDGETALMLATFYGWKVMVEVLLGRGAKMEAMDNSGYTALHHATLTCDLSISTLLLDRGANLEAEDRVGRTPLHIAVLGYHKPLVELLLNRGAKIEAKDNTFQTPLGYAVQSGHLRVIELLLGRGARVQTKDQNGCSIFHYATLGGKKPIMELLLDSRAEIEAHDNSGLTPLHYAVKTVHWGVVELLLDHGAMMEAKDQNECSALHHAILGGHRSIVKLLVSRGAEIEVQDNIAKTPLHYAVKTVHREVVELLLDCGARIQARDQHGRSSLHHAILGGHKPIVTLLLNHGAEVEAQDNAMKTPLHYAAQTGHKDLVELLLDRSAEVDAKETELNVVLIPVAPVGSIIYQGADIGSRNQHTHNSVHLAIGGSQNSTPPLLLDSAAPTSQAGNLEETRSEVTSWIGSNKTMDMLQRRAAVGYTPNNPAYTLPRTSGGICPIVVAGTISSGQLDTLHDMRMGDNATHVLRLSTAVHFGREPSRPYDR